jgi:hypothetical protein
VEHGRKRTAQLRVSAEIPNLNAAVGALYREYESIGTQNGTYLGTCIGARKNSEATDCCLEQIDREEPTCRSNRSPIATAGVVRVR